jgi:hypothetical protein
MNSSLRTVGDESAPVGLVVATPEARSMRLEITPPATDAKIIGMGISDSFPHEACVARLGSNRVR